VCNDYLQHSPVQFSLSSISTYLYRAGDDTWRPLPSIISSLLIFSFSSVSTGHTHKRPYLWAVGPLTQRVLYVLDNNLRI
jgi:hypothetical protein